MPMLAWRERKRQDSSYASARMVRRMTTSLEARWLPFRLTFQSWQRWHRVSTGRFSLVGGSLICAVWRVIAWDVCFRMEILIAPITRHLRVLAVFAHC